MEQPALASDEIVRIAHDPDVLELFYRAHVVRVERFIARRVADPHVVADLTAEVFLGVIDGADRYRPARGSAVGWLYGIAWHVVAAHHRDQARRLRAQSRIEGRALVDDADLDALIGRIDAESAARTLRASMARLPDGQRAVLELTALDGLSVTEAAHALGIREGTARVHLHRARHALQGVLADPSVSASDTHRVVEEIR